MAKTQKNTEIFQRLLTEDAGEEDNFLFDEEEEGAVPTKGKISPQDMNHDEWKSYAMKFLTVPRLGGEDYLAMQERAVIRTDVLPNDLQHVVLHYEMRKNMHMKSRQRLMQQVDIIGGNMLFTKTITPLLDRLIKDNGNITLSADRTKAVLQLFSMMQEAMTEDPKQYEDARLIIDPIAEALLLESSQERFLGNLIKKELNKTPWYTEVALKAAHDGGLAEITAAGLLDVIRSPRLFVNPETGNMKYGSLFAYLGLVPSTTGMSQAHARKSGQRARRGDIPGDYISYRLAGPTVLYTFIASLKKHQKYYWYQQYLLDLDRMTQTEMTQYAESHPTMTEAHVLAHYKGKAWKHTMRAFVRELAERWLAWEESQG